jgi:hypothetical protein
VNGALTALAALVGAACLSCSPATIAPPDAGGDAGDGGGGSIPETCENYAYQRCNRLSACSTTALAVDFGDMPTCRQVFTLTCEAELLAPSTGSSLNHFAQCTAARMQESCSDIVYNQNPPLRAPSRQAPCPPGPPARTARNARRRGAALLRAAHVGSALPSPSLGALARFPPSARRA